MEQSANEESDERQEQASDEDVSHSTHPVPSQVGQSIGENSSSSASLSK
mgnify:CR=1 FL=1